LTLDEREKLLDCVATADGGCRGCVCMLLEHLEAHFPNEGLTEQFGQLDYDNIEQRAKRARNVLESMQPHCQGR
jgi:hypothetical protein